MKRRQLQQDEIAAKRANYISNGIPSPTKIQLKTHDVEEAVPRIETLQANPKVINQKKRPKTHFRKTKKPGRA